MLAADSGSGLPLLDLFWTMLMVFVLVLAVWLVVAVLRDVFVRDDLTTGARVGWVVLLLFLPVMGSLAYQVVRKRDVSVQEPARGVTGRVAGRSRPGAHLHPELPLTIPNGPRDRPRASVSARAP